jgi:hypothetical protein
MVRSRWIAMVEPTDIERLEQVIAHTVAPAFMFAGIAGFIALMVGRLNSIIDRSRTLNSIGDQDPQRGHLRADIPRLVRRAQLLNRAVLLAIGSALALTLLILLSFASAFLRLHHVPLAAVLFALAVALLGTALLYLAREVRIALNQLDHHP